jgi:hypothetical protein
VQGLEIEYGIMPTIHVEAEVSRKELLEAVEQFSSLELAQFVGQVLALRARREAPGLSASESELLLRINRGMPEELSGRYGELIAKRNAEILGQDELTELLRLTDAFESFEADRVAALGELARIRGVSLEKLMAELGIPASDHD